MRKESIEVRKLLEREVLVGLILVLATTSTAFADKIKTDYDKAASFSQFKTYAFKPGLLMIAEDRDRLDSRFFKAMRQELNNKGMTEVQENPNVYVTYFGTLGAVSSSGSLYAPGQLATYDWGIPQGWSGVTSTTSVQGSVLIEMVNASTRQLVWRATLQGLVKNLGNPDKQEQRINEVIQKAFKEYPPNSKR
jgi:Domain of unknown function (DUF4136)